MTLFPESGPGLLVVVGGGGVGKTTLAAALGVQSARAGRSTLVVTFDPSHRLKDALGVGRAAAEREVDVPLGAPARLAASLLDAGATFDRLVAAYAPDAAARERILGNRFYRHLAGSLSGVLEYMAVERLFELFSTGEFEQIILDTPPTRAALDFLGAPERIVGFLDSGALKVTQKDWFTADGRFRPSAGWGVLGRGVEEVLDRVVGLDFLRDMIEFFQAFGPLYDGFRARAEQVKALLVAPETNFLLVSGPGAERVPDALFFARKLVERGHRLGPLVVNRVFPRLPASDSGDAGSGGELFRWRGEEDARGLELLASLVGTRHPVVPLPLARREPTDLESLEVLGGELLRRL
ncbi:MAG: ArsA-related P-loop ATPase [Thermoanaerobaculia bacterium]|nr:ArsA-related P-loop ATPase [Thermoanaerobaculia bacterium]